jgi:Bacterial self-protective colicin-like immunity
MSIEYLTKIINELDSGKISIGEFCARYETAYNFNKDFYSVGKEVSKVLESLFDVVVLYSPFNEEIEKIPNYRNEDQVRLKIEEVRKILANSK